MNSTIDLKYYMHGLLAVAGFFIFLLLAPQPLRAQPATACDPEYMDALEARAWLEAQREITQNQNLILKPDSVLEYTCFDKLVGRAGRNFAIPGFGTRQFSEMNAWGTIPITMVGPGTTDAAINNVVGLALVGYLEANFEHSFLSGRSILDHEVEIIDGNDNYLCDRMALVWQHAKCMNFQEYEALYDGFYDFARYMTEDPRALPLDYPTCEIPETSYALAGGVAFNDDEDLFILSPEETPYDLLGYNEDVVQSFVERMNPPTAGGCDDSYRIPTGVQVARSDLNGGDPYNEFVCTQPGCSYIPTGLNSGNCIP